MDLPTTNADRIAELEADVSELRALLAGLRNRDPEATTAKSVRFVRTAEREPSGGDHGYSIIPDAELPIVFLDTTYSDGEILSRGDRSSYPRAVVRSQWGWLPPDVEMMVTPGLDDRYLFACRPPLLHGKLYAGDGYEENALDAATWDGPCEVLTLGGPALVQIYRQNDDGDYEAAEYSNGDPVLMYWHNFGDALVENVLLTSDINADNQWVAWPESCDPCSPGS